MNSQISFTGLAELKTIFEQFPENAYRKPLNAAFRKAAAPVKKAMTSALPPYLTPIKRAIKAKASRASKGEPSLAVGVFSSGETMYRNRRGQLWNPWMLAYWHNYGTLANRSGSHRFATQRRKSSAGRSGGIQAGYFIEKAWTESQSAAQGTFDKNVSEEIEKFLQKEAAK